MYRNILGRKELQGVPTYSVRIAPGGLVAIVNASSRFTLGSTGWLQTSVASAGSLLLSVPELPTEGRLLEATFKVTGGSGHAGLPGTMPTVLVVRELNNGAHQLGVTVTDTSATVAAYQTPHDLVVSDLNLDLRTTDFDWVELGITGEAGANSSANQFRLLSVDLLIGT